MRQLAPLGRGSRHGRRLGLGSYRFSVEWSRIEPAEDEWSTASLDHYRRMIAGCRERGSFLSSPSTTSRLRGGSQHRGGWEAADTPERFCPFLRAHCCGPGDMVGMACTIERAEHRLDDGVPGRRVPSGRAGPERRRVVTANFCRAHRLAVEELRSGPGDYPVGLTLSMTEYQAMPGGEERRDRIRRSMEDVFLEATEGDDFVGVQTYSRMRVGPEGALDVEPGVPVTTMGYERWPQGLEATIRRAWEVTGGTPIFVTENGISTEDDSERVSFVSDALRGCFAVSATGSRSSDTRTGAFSTTSSGRSATHRDLGSYRSTGRAFERNAKPSAEWFAKVARANALVR